MNANHLRKIRQLLGSSKILIFSQVLLILMLIISLMLFTSSSFYQSMLENSAAFTLQDSAAELDKLDFNSETILEDIARIEKEKVVYIEIYGSNSPEETQKLFDTVTKSANAANQSDTQSEYIAELTEQLFASYDRPIHLHKRETSFDNGDISQEKTIPLIGYNSKNFTPAKTYMPTVRTGIFCTGSNNYEYFMMQTISSDGSMLYLTSVLESHIYDQAKVITLAVTFILIITFFLIAFISYMYITRITKPIKQINEVTKAMAETNDISLRIPARQRTFLTDTDEAISRVNYLYEKLILTQLSLKEKTEALSNRLEELDEAREFREKFIADSSHELKTPISIIQGYAEGAKYLSGDSEALNEYCDTIIDECERMNKLVVNMMTLSKLQHENSLNPVEFNVAEFLGERFSLYNKIFENHGITAKNLVKGDYVGVADVYKLTFVLNNIVSNAVSYIGGEKRIILRLEDEGQVYRIFVFNSGNQIPKEAAEKLWNSFYRQDAARDRSEGHFGLGLSIVKTIQDAHNQTFGFANVYGGVEFWFDVKKADAK